MMPFSNTLFVPKGGFVEVTRGKFSEWDSKRYPYSINFWYQDWFDYFNANIRPETTITKGWLTVMADPSGLDISAVFQKIISTTNLTGTGWIEEDGTGSIVVRFDLTSTDTALLTPDQNYYYDIKLLGSDGNLYVPETGRMIARQNVTKAIS